KIELQVKQAVQQSEESYKRLLLASSSIHQAEENLRSVNISLEEGLATSSNVLEAQTSWLLAHSAMIDAQIDVMLSEAYLKRTLGTLKY
ncbi:MAG: TolC family protein, partial [Bacteroidaceae bacterium]|nr:TolC family protein [Bacteroidaceae bacterium]